MLWAHMKGKLPIDQEGAEDLLTSHVFGALRYVLPSSGLFPILARAVGDGAADLRAYLHDAEVSFEFWPWLPIGDSIPYGCEPDVLLRVASPTSGHAVILVEAKYLSGKSSFADPAATTGDLPRDQLAREWVLCQRLAQMEGAEPFLLFVTADYAVPAAELRESQNDLARCGLPYGRLLWLSWRHVAAALDSRFELLRDLRELLEHRYGFREFEGIRLRPRVLPWTLSKLTGGRQSKVGTFEWAGWPKPSLCWRLSRG